MICDSSGTPNSQYNLAAPNSLPIRISTFQRRRMYQYFLDATQVEMEDTILDVGVTSDRTYTNSNYLEAWYPTKSAITAAGIDDASFLQEIYPGMRFLQANGLHLPFRDSSFDVVHASAVLEHIGGFENQVKLVKECARVACKTIFLTTPNRWFPIEFHTVLPVVHWLPKPAFRMLMRRAGLSFFADESNLNLMTARELQAAADAVETIDARVGSVSLLGWPSNLLLVGKKR